VIDLISQLCPNPFNLPSKSLDSNPTNRHIPILMQPWRFLASLPNIDSRHRIG
jgi:hypothetical protein